MNSKNHEILKKNEVVENRNEIPSVSFSEYSFICNFENDCFQKKGILRSEFYESIVSDETTSFINIDNRSVPIFVDIKYGFSMGYDTAKCDKFASVLEGDKLVLSFPIDKLSDLERSQLVDLIKSREDFSVYFTDHEGKDRELLTALINEAGKTYSEEALSDDRLDGEDAQAAMYLYACRVSQKGEQVNNLCLSDIVEYFEKQIGPVYSRDGGAVTRLDLGCNLSDEVFDKIWKLYDDRFENLGSHKHPISMQDSKDEFINLVKSGNTMVAATYVKGETDEYDTPACFTFFLDNIDNLYWIDKDYISKKIRNIGGPNDILVFTPGLVSSSEHGSLSALPIGLFARAGGELGMGATIFYENTNLSKNYVPRIVDRFISRSCVNSDYTKSEQIDKVEYRLIHVAKQTDDL